MEGNRRIILIIPLIIYLSFSTFGYAYAIDNNCKITPIHILELRIIFSCIEERLDALENASSGDLTTAICIGNGGSNEECIFSGEVGNELQFKRLFGDGIAVLANSTHILYDSEISCIDGSGVCLSATSTETELRLKKLTAGSGITLSDNGTRILVNSTGGGGGDTTVCGNVGTGNPLHKSGTNCNAFSLIAGSGVTITNTTDDYTIAKTPDSVWQLQSYTIQQITKTNIGTTYIDVYNNALFDVESINYINCDNATQFLGILMWDYVGTGTQSVRVVEVSNNANILFERTDITSDSENGGIANIGNSPIYTKPVWCNSGLKSVELQAKSTIAGDDPISRGYTIWAR